MKYIIEDWIGNRMFPGDTFDSFEEGWDFIYEHIPDIDNQYDDIFVVELSEKTE